VEEVARNVHGNGRSSSDGAVHVRLRRIEATAEGVGRPLVLAEALLDLASGSVSLVP
jgi:hypothetical protein